MHVAVPAGGGQDAAAWRWEEQEFQQQAEQKAEEEEEEEAEGTGVQCDSRVKGAGTDLFGSMLPFQIYCNLPKHNFNSNQKLQSTTMTWPLFLGCAGIAYGPSLITVLFFIVPRAPLLLVTLTR